VGVGGWRLDGSIIPTCACWREEPRTYAFLLKAKRAAGTWRTSTGAALPCSGVARCVLRFRMAAGETDILYACLSTSQPSLSPAAAANASLEGWRRRDWHVSLLFLGLGFVRTAPYAMPAAAAAGLLPAL